MSPHQTSNPPQTNLVTPIEDPSLPTTTQTRSWIKKALFSLLALCLLLALLVLRYYQSEQAHQHWIAKSYEWHSEPQRRGQIAQELLPTALSYPQWSGALKAPLASWALEIGREDEAMQLLKSAPNQDLLTQDPLLTQALEQHRKISLQALKKARKELGTSELQQALLRERRAFLASYPLPKIGDQETPSSSQMLLHYLSLQQFLCALLQVQSDLSRSSPSLTHTSVEGYPHSDLSFRLEAQQTSQQLAKIFLEALELEHMPSSPQKLQEAIASHAALEELLALLREQLAPQAAPLQLIFWLYELLQPSNRANHQVTVPITK